MVKGLAVSTVLLAFGLAAVSPSEVQSTAEIRLIEEANQQLLNEGNLDFTGDYFSPDYVNHSSATGGPDLIRGFVTELRTAFPDLHVEVEILLQEGDTVAWRRTHEGTFQADLGGVRATGQKLVWQAVVVSRFTDGMIVEEWGVSDLSDRAGE